MCSGWNSVPQHSCLNRPSERCACLGIESFVDVPNDNEVILNQCGSYILCHWCPYNEHHFRSISFPGMRLLDNLL